MDTEINKEALLEAIEAKQRPGRKPVKDKETERLKADLRAQIANANSLVERLEATYKLQECLNESSKEDKPTPGLKVLGSFNEPDVLDTIAKQHMKPGNHYHWSNAHPTIYDFRRGNGYKPVLNEKGERVIVGDAVLVSMPEREHYEKVVLPKQRRKSAVRHAIVNEFKDVAHDSGVKVFGKIQYDDGEVVRAGEDRDE